MFRLLFADDVLLLFEQRVKLSGLSRSRWVSALVLRELGEERSRALSKGEDAGGVDASEGAVARADGMTLGTTVTSLLQAALEDRPNVMKELESKALASAAIARAPKDREVDAGLEESYLSLRKVFDRLPGVDDLTGELKRVKQELAGAMAKIRWLELSLVVSRNRLDKVGEWSEWRASVVALAKQLKQYVDDGDVRGLDVGLTDLKKLLWLPLPPK